MAHNLLTEEGKIIWVVAGKGCMVEATHGASVSPTVPHVLPNFSSGARGMAGGFRRLNNPSVLGNWSTAAQHVLQNFIVSFFGLLALGPADPFQRSNTSFLAKK